MKQQNPFRDFDLPKEHLIESRHYIPPRARESEEIARRRDLGAGVVLMEHQKRGVEIARVVLTSAVEPDEQEYIARMLAAAGLNTAWYSYARSQFEVMRRRLKLPDFTAGASPKRDVLVASSVDIFGKLIKRSDQLILAKDIQLPSLANHERLFGRAIGNASLKLACLPLVDRQDFVDSINDDFEVQRLAREQCLRALHEARTLHSEVGSHPSIAQLADVDSHFSVYLRRKAPDAVYSALKAA